MRSDHSSVRVALAVGLLLGFAYVLIATVPGMIPEIASSSEAREARVAKLIFEGNDLALPMRDGLIPSKPPLFHVLSALLAQLSGSFSVSTTRFVSILSGGLMLAFTFFFAWLFRGLSAHSSEEDRWNTALFSVGILVTCYGFNRLCLDSRVDVLFSLLCTSACAFGLWAIWLVREGENLLLTRLVNLAVWVSIALAVLAKGPLGLVLPLLVILPVSFAATGFLDGLKYWFRPRIGWIVFLLMVSPWYLWSYQHWSDDFVLKQLLFENVTRFFGGAHITERPWWYYFPSLIRTAFPWGLILLLVLGVDYWTRVLRRPVHSASVSLFPGAIAFWFVIGFIFLSLSSGKRHSYLLPLFPALSIYLGWRIVDGIHRLSELEGWRVRQASRNFIEVAICSLGLLLLFSEVLIKLRLASYDRLALAVKWVNHFIIPYQLLLGVPLLLLLSLRIGLFLKEQYFPYTDARRLLRFIFQFSWCSVLLAFLVLLSAGLGVKANLKGYSAQSRQLQRALGRDTQLYVVRDERDESFDVLLYYFSGDIVNLSPRSTSLVCGRPMLAHRQWYRRIQDERRDLIFWELLRLNTPIDQMRSRYERELVLFTCRSQISQGVI